MPVLKSHKLKTKVLTAEMNSEAKVCNRIVWVGQHYCKVWLRFYFSHLSGKICFSEESFWRNIAPDRKYEDWNTPGDATKYFPKYWWEAGTSKCHLPLPPRGSRLYLCTDSLLICLSELSLVSPVSQLMWSLACRGFLLPSACWLLLHKAIFNIRSRISVVALAAYNVLAIHETSIYYVGS